MKKFDFKKLLILALALVLVFALVACGPKTPVDNGDDDDDVPTTVTLNAEDYFSALWKASKGIGSTAIADSSDLNFALGLDVDIAIKTGTTTSVGYKLGVEAKAIYDRDNTGSDENVGKYSAAMLKIVDRTKTTNSNLISLYYYLDDPSAIYVQAYDQFLKLQFNADNDAENPNGVVFENLTNAMNYTFESDNAFIDGKSVDDFVLAVTNSFGPDFDLDDLANILFQVVGMDMGDLISMIQGYVTFDVEDADNASLLDVLKALGKVAVGNISKTEIDGGYTWSANLSNTIKQLLSGFTDQLINTDNTTLGLSFNTNTDGTDMTNFVINLERKYIAANTTLCAQIAINQLEVTSTTAGASGTGLFGMTKTNFSADHQFNIDATVAIDDAMLMLTYDDGQNEQTFANVAALYSDEVPTVAPLDGQQFAGVLRFEADGTLNLMKSDSTTAAYVRAYYKTNEASAVETLVAEASFKNVNGIGTAKIWMDETNDYAEIARDYIILNTVKGMHKSNEYTAAIEGEPTREELLSGTNGAVVSSLIDALNNDASTFCIEGIELQTMLWDLFFVADAPQLLPQYDNVFQTLPSSEYKWGVNILTIAKTAVAMASQDSENAFALSTLDGIANTLLKQTTVNNVVTNFGIFKTLSYKNSNGVYEYDSFESQEDIYAWAYKGAQSVINRMTDAGIIPAIKIEINSKGAYAYDADGNFVTADKAESGATLYNIVKATTLEENSQIGLGTWYYQNSTTIDKYEARKMWAIATGTFSYINQAGVESTVAKFNTDELSQVEKDDLYDNCIENGFVSLFDGSSFIGGTAENADNGEWLDNILDGSVDATFSYVTEDGATVSFSYTDVAENVASATITFKLQAGTAYTIPASANLDSFDSTTADCTLDMSPYMDQVREDYENLND